MKGSNDVEDMLARQQSKLSLKDTNSDSGSVSNFSGMGSVHSHTSGGGYVDPTVAAKEQKAVFWSKVMVVTVLLLAVSSMAAASYIITENQEYSEFETQVRTPPQ